MSTAYRHWVLVTVLLTLVVIVMGAYVRLSDAGLACPDWPGCYGQVLVPTSDSDLTRARAAFPDRPLVVHRAWKEMIHRYLAGGLGIAIILLALGAYRRRRDPRQPLALPMVLVGLVMFQAVLGMWTVTLSLKPVVVTAHLLGGMTTLALLWWLWLRPGPTDVSAPIGVRLWALASVVMVIVQLTLGGWTSANYAALACPEFPTCQGSWWTNMRFGDAFQPWRELGRTSQGEPLRAQALVTIQVTHRVGALLTVLIVGSLALASLMGPDGRLRYSAGVVLIVLLVQLSLGAATVLMARPLSFAVAHNGVAALLLLAVITLARCRTHPVA